jgi:hypothetical protein
MASLIFKTQLINKKSQKMKLGLQNYAIIMPREKSGIIFNNKLEFTKA